MKYIINNHNLATIEPITPDLVDEIWKLCNKPGETFPKSWPLYQYDFMAWALNNATEPDGSFRNMRCVVLVPCTNAGANGLSESESVQSIAGVVCCDLVTEANAELFPGSQIGDVNISYMTFRGHRGAGVASVGVQAMVAHVLANDKLPILRIRSNNDSSISVAKKCGFLLTAQSFVEDPKHEARRILDPDYVPDPVILPDVMQTFRLPQDPLAQQAVRLNAMSNLGLNVG